MLYDYLKKNYRDGEPIFFEDIHIDGIQRNTLRQQIKTLVDAGKIARYEKGIYYIPKITRFKSSAGPSPETVARYKYISRGGKTDGYYSGSTFANLIGISLQVPMKKEIISNNIAAIVREISIGNQTFIVRQSHIPVSGDNAKVLQFLDLLKNLISYIDSDLNDVRKKLKNYADANHITREDIDKYIRQYPDSTFRYYYEMRLDDVLA